jgi:hypothetical protein
MRKDRNLVTPSRETFGERVCGTLDAAATLAANG